MIAGGDGTPDFHPFRSQRRGSEAVLFAFDLIEHDGDDLRDLPLIERKRRLARLARPGREPSGTASTWQVTVRPCSSMSAAWGWRRALSQRAIEGVAQGEEPGERGGAPGAGGVALARPS